MNKGSSLLNMRNITWFRLLRAGCWTGAVACAIAIGLWSYSFSAHVRCTRSARSGDIVIETLPGAVLVWRLGTPSGSGTKTEWFWYRVQDGYRLKTEWGFVFEWMRPGSTREWVVQVPLWIPFLTSAAATVALYHAARRARQRLVGCCPRCGYPLTGVGPRCPECGEVLVQRG